MNIRCILFVCFCILLSSSTVSADYLCGKVFDGLTEGRFDMQYQTSQSTIGANWSGFGNNVLSYDWGVFSELPRTASKDTSQCLRQLRYSPDVQYWTNVRKSTTAVNSKLKLEVGNTYYVVVRATLRTGEQIFAFSNGVSIAPSENDSIESSTQTNSKNDNEKQTRNSQSVSSCPIDEANRCTSGTISVAEKLKEFYGEPVFFNSRDSFIVTTFDNDDDDDDGDDDDGDNVYLPIVVGVLAAVLLLLCCLLLLALLLGGGKFSAPQMPERTPKSKPPPAAAGIAISDDFDEQKGYGQRTNADTGDVGTSTVVEFPDTNIRRLSISHRDDAAAAVADEPNRGRSRIPHPVMSSASSSFRDYRSSVNH